MVGGKRINEKQNQEDLEANRRKWMFKRLIGDKFSRNDVAASVFFCNFVAKNGEH